VEHKKSIGLGALVLVVTIGAAIALSTSNPIAGLSSSEVWSSPVRPLIGLILLFGLGWWFSR
jgi:hypothetical protein